MTIAVAAGNAQVSAAVFEPGTAKNVITVGASENYNQNVYGGLGACGTAAIADNAYDIAQFSGHGSLDGRIKPDVVAPGTRSMGAATRDALYADEDSGPCMGHYLCEPRFVVSNGTYGEVWGKGTSFATPLAAGAAGLLGQWYRNTHNNVAPSPAMKKAMIINSALDIQGGLGPARRVHHNHSRSYSLGLSGMGEGRSQAQLPGRGHLVRSGPISSVHNQWRLALDWSFPERLSRPACPGELGSCGLMRQDHQDPTIRWSTI